MAVRAPLPGSILYAETSLVGHKVDSCPSQLQYSYFILCILYDVMITYIKCVIRLTMSILFPSGVRFLSRATADLQTRFQKRGFRRRTGNEPLQGFNTQREFPRGNSKFIFGLGAAARICVALRAIGLHEVLK